MATQTVPPVESPAVHTNAKGSKKPILLADGFPDYRQFKDVFDFMKALKPEHFDQGHGVGEKVEIYLYRINPPVSWAKDPSIPSYVDKPQFGFEQGWIGDTFGGGEWRVQIKRGAGEVRRDLFNSKVMIPGTPWNLDYIADERRKARGIIPPSAPTTAPPAGAVSQSADAISAMERMQQRYLDADQARRDSFDPMKEASKIAQAQRELLTRPEVKSDQPSLLQILEMMDKRAADARRETMEMMERIMKREGRDPAEQPKSLLDSLKEAIAITGLIKGQGTGGELAEAAAPPSFIQTVMEGAPKVVEAVSGAMDRFNTAQRNAQANARAQQPPVNGQPAIEVPAAPAPEQLAWNQMRAAGARMIVRMFPAPDAEYEEHGYDCADLMHGAMPDVARWFYEHLANDNRPADPVTDPILMPIVASPHVIEFAKDFARYFTEETPAPAAGSTEKGGAE